MKVIIDRIENETAVCSLENGSIINAPAVLFENIKEGRVYDITVNTEEEKMRKEKAQSRLNALFNRKVD